MPVKIGIFDTETAPSLAWVWGAYQQDVIAFEKHWFFLSFSWKWWGDDAVIYKGLNDYPNYRKDLEDDTALVTDLWKLFDEADVIVAHNGDEFDIKKSNARFIAHGFPPPSPYKTVDTLKLARKHFKFEKNNLGELGQYLGLGGKVPTLGFATWRACMAGDDVAWNKMKDYNIRDTTLLENVYGLLRPWAATHPDLNVLSGEAAKEACPVCQSHNVHRRGTQVAKTRQYQRFHCQDCGKWYAGELSTTKNP